MGERSGGLAEAELVVGAPVVLAALEIFHPHAHDLFSLPLDRWLLVHYAQVFLFPLAALAMAQLTAARSDGWAWAARALLFVFACAYVAFDTAAGVVTGELVRAAQASGHPEAWRPAVYAVWEHPVIGSASATPPLLGSAGTLALLLASIASAVSMKRGGDGWGPVLAVAATPLGLMIFLSHAWPGGPVTFGTLGLAGAWTLWARGRAARSG